MSQPFSQYDKRHYPTVNAVTGYQQWASTYDQTVYDELDLPLLNRLQTVDWPQIKYAVDLGCGTGRIGQWLAQQGLEHIDGVDCSHAMAEIAMSKQSYNQISVTDMAQTPFLESSYNLVITSLALCHVSDLSGFYQEAAHLLGNQGICIVVDYHPFFLLNGIPTHFESISGESIAIDNSVHLHSDHIQNAHQVKFKLLEMHERLVDVEWIQQQPTMVKYQHQPISFCMVWQKHA
ncbi:MAG: class I SAM-dependent methyltransferase [Cyanobacteria bacterium P01_D01_bin.156]